MKVLFAVSNESISEGIVKQYQQEYKEILSYKNVYYFNAILKEIQKDKTYDRIIISEELEPFSNDNYENIDKFLFEKLDNISDEAQDSNGQETSIIFICTDRRTKGSSFLVKLFSIGVYNALLGKDRVKSEVCRLIYKPRIKKEAKAYYGIDSEDAKYDQASDSEVTELEIQNIRSYFKRLGKNTDKYVECFNNIIAQYNDEQLRIVINCLPVNVKAVLESNSAKYQEIMSASGGKIKSVAGQALEMQAKENGIKMDLLQNAKSTIDRPIVIPSSVRRRTTPAPQTNQIQSTGTVKRTVVTNDGSAARPVVPQPVVQRPAQSVAPAEPVQTRPVATPAPVTPVRPEPVAPIVEEPDDLLELIDETDDLLSMNDNAVAENVAPVVEENLVADDSLMPGMDLGEDDDMLSDLLDPTDDLMPGVEEVPAADDSLLPGMDLGEDDDMLSDLLDPTDDLMPGVEEVPAADESLLPGMDLGEDDDMLSDLLDPTDDLMPGIEDKNEETQPVKKGRGRPRKLITEPPKPKGKRGRPRKVVNQDGEETVLPGMGFEDDEEDYEYTDEVDLPDLDDLDDFVVPGLDSDDDLLSSIDSVEEDSSGVLPGFDDLDNEDSLLPGMDLDTNDDLLSGGDGVLPGFEDDGTLPGMDDFGDDALIPGLDDFNDSLDGDLGGGVLPGFDDSDDLLTTFDDSSNVLPGMDDDILGGMQAPEEPVFSSFDSTPNFDTPNSNNAPIESIKPNIDYSMSSLNSLLTKENKIVTFIGTTKNGTSFLVNNLGLYFDSVGINTAILDMTKNRNSYYIYTNSDEELRNISANAMENLERGVAKGIRVKENLTVYTAIPDNGKVYNNAESILSTLVQNHSLILIDCDYDTDPSYFASCQEIYLVQSMDVLTIQPLTAFLKGLKTKNVLEPEKIRIAINKYVKLKEFSAKDFIAGMSCYNDPSMSIMTELFNREMVKFCIIDFEDGVYAKYLDSMASCKVTLNGYSKSFMANLMKLGDMVYPLTSGSKQTYGRTAGPTTPAGYGKGGFSNSTSNTLDKMRKKY